MSDRGNVQFIKDNDKSVIISSYWGDIGFVTTACHYAVDLKKEVDEITKRNPNWGEPLTRLEPEIISVDFVHYLCESGWIKDRDSGIYLYDSDKQLADKVFQIDLDNPQATLDLPEIKSYWDNL